MKRFQIFKVDYCIKTWIGESDQFQEAVEIAKNNKFVDRRGCESTPKIYFMEDCVELPERAPKEDVAHVRDTAIISRILIKVMNFYAGQPLMKADYGEIRAIILALFEEYGLPKELYQTYMMGTAMQLMVY